MDEKHDYALQFKDVSFYYNQPQSILDKLSFHINKGEFVTIVGASGTGKSTIFRLVVGLEQPTEGFIFLNGDKETNRLGKVGYMPQNDLLIPWRRVAENVALPLEGKNRDYDKQFVVNRLKDFGLDDVANKYPHELSGGMRQRVSFLRATLTGSNLLLLDEPFSSLDAMTKLYMQEWLLEQWNETKSSIVFITHDISEALFLSDKIFIISDTPIQMIEEIEVPLKRPRNRQQLDEPSLINLKNELINRFKMKVT